MRICYVETEAAEREYFAQAFVDDEVDFADATADVPAETEILSIFIYSQIDAAFLDAHPHLRLITTRSTGVDHIDIAECARRGVTVCFVPNYGENTVAEHTFALILVLSRRLREALAAQTKLTARVSLEALSAFDLKGKTLGVVGTGRVGRRVIRIAKAFEMDVVAHDPEEQAELARTLGFRYVPLDELLGAAHIITLHLPLLPQTHHLLDRAAFAKCRRGVVIINTARGAIIDTDAFNEALDSGIVGAAGLDVLEDERVMHKDQSAIIAEQIFSNLQNRSPHEAQRTNPERVQELKALMENNRLLKRPNVVFTPHAAFHSVESVERINRTTLENITAFLNGTPVNLLLK